MLNNPRTTLAGYLVLLSSLATLVAHVLTTGFTSADLSAVVTAVMGLGLISAKDGGH